ncbi:hypothetical protein [Variovorax sp. PAMC26660]|uniref:hypothetical protein n=1 Tax=Variovorax sp. PAMC26660 TaxID=2762322 RepID=UPI00164D4907|nr:hypothetical protein [Variovorax sp. PAMC26660]QNK66583.1 hypothetical protein H7F35_25845 [Variovorax sp. PAMC26660]
MLALLCLAGCETNRHSRDRDYEYYGAPPSRPYYESERESPPARDRPRLSDMQQRAFDNCIVLPTHLDRARCRATVMSTVR